jgi:hypothetical protein
MEKFNIGVSILSMTQNGNLLYDNTPKGRSEIRRGNDYGADLVRKHPGQIRAVRRRAAAGYRRNVSRRLSMPSIS